MAGIENADDIAVLMGIEGNIRQIYYHAFYIILKDHMMARTKQPPMNEVNTLILSGHDVLYTLSGYDIS